MDQDLWLKSLFVHGPSLLSSLVNDSVIDSQVTSRKQKIYRFIRNKHAMLFKERPPVFNKSPAFKPIPVELFWDCPIEQRRKLFFKNLKRGEILILKVINDILPDDYKLQVLAKHQCCMKLDDLSLVMYLPKLDAELKHVGGELSNFDVIRAALCSCDVNSRKLLVTLSSTIIEDEAETVRLGKVGIDELPSYVGDIQVQHSSYKTYFHQTPAFLDPNWANQLQDMLGLEKNYLYSFHDEWDGKKYPAKDMGSSLKKEHLLMLSNTHYTKATEHYEAKNVADAILCLNQAIAVYPQNKMALVSRGTIYANSNDLRKAFCDTEKALQIDPKFKPAREQMSVLLVSAAKAHMDLDNLEAAKESLTEAITLDHNNEAIAMLLAKLEKEVQKKEVAGNSSNAASTSETSKIKKKKKKHQKTHDKSGKRKERHHKSKSKSPKRKKTQSVVIKVKH